MRANDLPTTDSLFHIMNKIVETMNHLPSKAYLTVLSFLLLGLLAYPAYATTKDKTLKITSSQWPPFVDKAAAGNGVAMDLVSKIFARAGYKTNTSVQNWNRALQGTSMGITDIIATAWYTPERNKTLHYSKPYFENTIRFVKRKGVNIPFNSFNDLQGLTVGVVNGYAYGETFNTAPGLIRIPKNNLIQNILLLQRGQLDLVIGDEWVIRSELTEYFPSAIKDYEFLGKPVDKRGVHIAVSRQLKNHKQIVTDFNKALDSMIKDGSYKKLIDAYRSKLIILQKTPL